MSARRVAVLRAQGRRRLIVLIVLVAVVACIVGGWGVSRSALLDVDRIVAMGLTDATDADRIEVLHAAGLSEGLPMTDFALGAAALGVQALPWVRSAEVHRRWPGTIKVVVRERSPVAVVPADAGFIALVDAYGYVTGRQPESGSLRPWDMLSPSSFRAVHTDDLPRIAVPFEGEPGGVHRDAGPGLSVVAALPEDLHAWVEAVTVASGSGVGASGSGVGLALVGGASVVLGDAALLDHKIAALRSVLAGVDLECIVSIDTTMADLTTVTRHPSCPSS